LPPEKTDLAARYRAISPFHTQPKGDRMRLIAFPQWDKLTSLLRGMARQSAADYA